MATAGGDPDKMRSYSEAANTLVDSYQFVVDDLVIAKRRPAGTPKRTQRTIGLGLRWAVERTNSWLSNFGQLRRNTDRKTSHRYAQLALAVTLLLTAKLIDWRNRRQH